MRDDVREAIEAARGDHAGGPWTQSTLLRRRSFEAVQAIVLAFLNECPDDLTMDELRDELAKENPMGDHEREKMEDARRYEGGRRRGAP